MTAVWTGREIDEPFDDHPALRAYERTTQEDDVMYAFDPGEIEAMRVEERREEALVRVARYMDHRPTCPLWGFEQDAALGGECRCGLDAALSALPESLRARLEGSDAG